MSITEKTPVTAFCSGKCVTAMWVLLLVLIAPLFLLDVTFLCAAVFNWKKDNILDILFITTLVWFVPSCLALFSRNTWFYCSTGFIILLWVLALLYLNLCFLFRPPTDFDTGEIDWIFICMTVGFAVYLIVLDTLCFFLAFRERRRAKPTENSCFEFVEIDHVFSPQRGQTR